MELARYLQHMHQRKIFVLGQFRENLFATAISFLVPVFVIQGREDVFTPTPVAIEYFNAIRAPAKSFT